MNMSQILILFLHLYIMIIISFEKSRRSDIIITINLPCPKIDKPKDICQFMTKSTISVIFRHQSQMHKRNVHVQKQSSF